MDQFNEEAHEQIGTIFNICHEMVTQFGLEEHMYDFCSATIINCLDYFTSHRIEARRAFKLKNNELDIETGQTLVNEISEKLKKFKEMKEYQEDLGK